MKKYFVILLIINCSLLIAPAQWVQQNSGTTFLSFYDVKMLNSNTAFIAAYYPDGYGWIYRTTNAGTTWGSVYQTQNPLNQLEAVSFSSVNTGTAVGGGIFGNGSFIIRTTNSGVNWTTQSTGTNWYQTDVKMIDANTIYTCGYSGTIFKTTDGGIIWIQQTSGTSRRLYGISFVNSSTGFAVGDTGTVLRTTNGGTAWTSQSVATNQTFLDVSFLDVNNGMLSGTGGVIYKTTNGGTGWTLLNSGVSVTLRALSIINSNFCTLVGASGTILRTTNGGINWNQQVSTLTQSLGGVSFIDTSTGTAVGDNGKIIRTTNGGFTFIANFSNEIPNQFSLSQNYPNPFNPSTKIKFDIPVRQIISKSSFSGSNLWWTQLKIYDILGNDVKTLINENLKPGSYEVDFNAVNFPSGVYYYKLIVGDFTESRKMILIK